MFGLGATELIIILVIVVVIFGGAKLPQLGEGIGKAIRNFKKSVNEPNEIDVTPTKDKESKDANKEETNS